MRKEEARKNETITSDEVGQRISEVLGDMQIKIMDIFGDDLYSFSAEININEYTYTIKLN